MRVNPVGTEVIILLSFVKISDKTLTDGAPRRDEVNSACGAGTGLLIVFEGFAG